MGYDDAEISKKTIALVERDDELLRNARNFLRDNGYRVIGLSHIDDLREMAVTGAIACAVAPIEAATMDALRNFVSRNRFTPVIVTCESANVDLVVDAVKAGATYVLAKPFETDDLIARVEKAIREHRVAPENPGNETQRGPSLAGFTLLTGREHEILAQIASGASSKEVGRRLGISPRTVDVHRSRIKEKLQVRRAVDLVKLVYDARLQNKLGEKTSR